MPRLPGWVRAGVAWALVALALAGGALAFAADDDPNPGSDSGAVASANPPQPTSATVYPPPGGTRNTDRAIPPHARRATVQIAPPARLNDIGEWLEYKRRSQIPALRDEARLFFRRGLLARQAAAPDEAVRLVQGAATLDPTFVAPHLVLAWWLAVREPGQALLQCGAVAEIVRQSFTYQLALEANALALVLQALLIGLIAAGFLLVVVRNPEIRHVAKERLARVLPVRAAMLWSWVALAIPYTLGIGLALPTVFLLATAWTALKARERTLLVTLTMALAALPWALVEVDRLASPAADDRGPFYGVLALENQPVSIGLERHYQGLADAHPDNGFVHFGLGWVARRLGHDTLAEQAYSRALVLMPGNDQIMNNLGNVYVLEGRDDEALAMYRKAVINRATNAAAYLNLSQSLTTRYEFRAAGDALGRASALSFDLVRSAKDQPGPDGLLPLVDQWLDPQVFAAALVQVPANPPAALALPPMWQGRIECLGWPFAVALALCVTLGLVVAVMQNRHLPLHRCNNCGRVVCRRCSERRRMVALCAPCASAERGAQSWDFARVLLVKQRARIQSAGRITRTALATLIPGFGLIALRRTFRAVLLLTVTAGLAYASFGGPIPFGYEPRFVLAEQEFPIALAIAPWVLVYAISITAYFAELARHDAREKQYVNAGRPRRLEPKPVSDAA